MTGTIPPEAAAPKEPDRFFFAAKLFAGPAKDSYGPVHRRGIEELERDALNTITVTVCGPQPDEVGVIGTCMVGRALAELESQRWNYTLAEKVSDEEGGDE